MYVRRLRSGTLAMVHLRGDHWLTGVQFGLAGGALLGSLVYVTIRFWPWMP